jgi:uncharacterized NAD-dependent epimerase/dehydratase family protein
MTDLPPHRLSPNNRLALLMHDAVGRSDGKMGYGLMRYGVAPVTAVIDRAKAGQSVRALTGIACEAPIVATVAEAASLGADIIVPAIAPAGGRLPQEWMNDLGEALAAGMSVVNGLHAPLADDPTLAPLVTRPGQFIWDIRQEPTGLVNGSGRAREVAAKRVLFVGTDMANGKMTAALEMDRAAKRRGLKSHFLATGQVGIAIAGDGIPLDAVRVDFATGAVEQLVLKYAEGADVLFVEGQGSLLHPASTATLSLLRGSMPTHLILSHRAGQTSISRAPWVTFPPLPEVIRLYEIVASAAGALSAETPGPRVVGIALNTALLSDDETARRAVTEVAEETGLPTTDVVRFGAEPLVDAVLADAAQPNPL